MVDADIVVTNAQCRSLAEVPGYRLRKLIEVALFKYSENDYSAKHMLPDFVLGAQGTEISGRGATEEDAAKDLASKLAEKSNYLTKENARMPNNLADGERIELQYFESIMVKDESS